MDIIAIVGIVICVPLVAAALMAAPEGLLMFLIFLVGGMSIFGAIFLTANFGAIWALTFIPAIAIFIGAYCLIIHLMGVMDTREPDSSSY